MRVRRVSDSALKPWASCPTSSSEPMRIERTRRSPFVSSAASSRMNPMGFAIRLLMKITYILANTINAKDIPHKVLERRISSARTSVTGAEIMSTHRWFPGRLIGVKVASCSSPVSLYCPITCLPPSAAALNMDIIRSSSSETSSFRSGLIFLSLRLSLPLHSSFLGCASITPVSSTMKPKPVVSYFKSLIIAFSFSMEKGPVNTPVSCPLYITGTATLTDSLPVLRETSGSEITGL